jgi:serine/threonine protein phosphatase 1
MNPPEGWEFICLMGNHEKMFLDCFDQKDFRYVYDKNVITDYFDGNLPDLRTILTKFPKDVLNWMRNLKYFHIEDNNVFAHAFYDPDLTPETQNLEVCIWDRMSDWETYQSDTLFLTHGHTPRKHGPLSALNRTNLDCGAYKHNRYVIGKYKQKVRGPIDFLEFEV